MHLHRLPNEHARLVATLRVRGFLTEGQRQLLWIIENLLNKQAMNPKPLTAFQELVRRRALYESSLPSKMAKPGATGPSTPLKPAPGGALSITQF